MTLRPPRADEFRRAMSGFATGVTVVTVRGADGEAYGMTVNAFSSVSLDPTLVLVCLSAAGRGYELVEETGRFSVNVLSADQEHVSRWFADGRRPRGSAMFADVPVVVGATGCPTIVGAVTTVDCTVDRTMLAGDHVIVVGAVVAFSHRPELEPLVFHAGSYRELAAAVPVPMRLHAV